MKAMKAMIEDRTGEHRNHGAAAHRSFADLREHLGKAARQLGKNARHDDQRHAVADPARGDLFTEPHQEQRTADDADDRADAEHHARIDDRGDALARAERFEADGDEIALDRGQERRCRSGYIG